MDPKGAFRTKVMNAMNAAKFHSKLMKRCDYMRCHFGWRESCEVENVNFSCNNAWHFGCCLFGWLQFIRGRYVILWNKLSTVKTNQFSLPSSFGSQTTPAPQGFITHMFSTSWLDWEKNKSRVFFFLFIEHYEHADIQLVVMEVMQWTFLQNYN